MAKKSSKKATPTVSPTPGSKSGGKATKPEEKSQAVPLGTNRKARFEHEVLEEFECGLVLTGTEVKSLRNHGLSFGDGFARFRKGELFLENLHISEYKQGTYANHKPLRTRKLLLHARELAKLSRAVEEKGLTLIPLAMYFNARGICKLKLGLCRGKKLHDKRESLKKRDAGREISRARREMTK